MNRLEYLTSLRRILEDGGLPREEINDAVRFYEEIFLDAGAEKEEETSENLGSPEELARKILMDSGIHVEGDAVFQMEAAKTHEEQEQEQEYAKKSAQQDRNNMLVKLIIALVTSPLWIGALCAVGGVAIGLLAIAAAILFAFFAVGFTMTVGGIVTLFTVYPAGIVLIGTGLIFLGLGGLIVVPAVKGIWKAMVSIFNGAVSCLRKIFGVRTVA